MIMPEFAVIEFTEESVYDIISSNWLVGRSACKFPRSQAEKLMMSHADPESTPNVTWEEVPIRIISMKANLLEARHRLKSVRDSSDGDTTDLDQKRRKKAPKYFMFEQPKHQSNSGELSSDDSIGDGEPVSKKSRVQKVVVSDDDVDDDDDVGAGAKSLQKLMCPSTSSHTMDMENSALEKSISEAFLKSPDAHNSTLRPEACACHEKLVRIENLQKRILNEIILNRQLVQENSRKLSAMTVNRGLKVDLPCKLPLQSTADYDRLCQWVVRDNNGENLSKQLSMVGGVSVNDVSRRIMRNLMSLALIALFSLTGRKKTKRAFNSSPLFEVVKQAILLSNKNYSLQQIEVGLKEVFNNAKDRLKKQ